KSRVPIQIRKTQAPTSSAQKIIMRSPGKVPPPITLAGGSLILALLELLSTPTLPTQQPAQISRTDNLKPATISAFAEDSTPVILRASDEDARRTSTSKVFADSRQEPQLDLFFPLTPGTWWLYRGTVRWTDSDTNKPAAAQASIKMQVERVIQKPEFTIAVISGFPSDVGWSNGQVEPKPSLLIETRNHEVF